MDEIKLEIYKIVSDIKPVDANIIVLIDKKDNNSLLPVVVGQLETVAISSTLLGAESPRPLTHDLFATFIDKMNVHVLKIFIYKVIKGVFYSYIYFVRNDGSEFYLDARTSDAIALALRFKAPIFTTSKVMDENRMEDKDAMSVLDIADYSIEMLKKKLEEAIEHENFEEASSLRDEISKRKKNGNS